MLLSLWLYLMSCLMSEAWYRHSLHQGFSKYDPWTSSINTTGHLWEMHILRPYPWITESETLPGHSNACRVWEPLLYIISIFSSYLHPVSQTYSNTVRLPFDTWLASALGQPGFISFLYEGRRASDLPQSFPHNHLSFISLHWRPSSWKETREMGRRPFSKWGEGISHRRTWS